MMMAAVVLQCTHQCMFDCMLRAKFYTEKRQTHTDVLVNQNIFKLLVYDILHCPRTECML